MNSTVYKTKTIHLEETILELDMECWAWACTLWYIDGQQDIRWISLNEFWSYWHFDGKRFWTGTLRSSKVFTTGRWRGIAGDMQCLTILQTEEKRERERGDRQSERTKSNHSFIHFGRSEGSRSSHHRKNACKFLIFVHFEVIFDKISMIFFFSYENRSVLMYSLRTVFSFRHFYFLFHRTIFLDWFFSGGIFLEIFSRILRISLKGRKWLFKIF